MVGDDVVGIDVGVSKVTFSNGESVSIDEDIPRDLLKRVADDTPYVRVKGDVCELIPAHEIYVLAVAAALQGQPTAGPEEFRTALAVPGWWTQRAVSRVRQALAEQQIDVALVNDAEAAVVEYQHAHHSLPGSVAVVSLRANQSSVVIVRNCRERPTAMASPILVHEEGGHDLDIAVLQHVVRGLTELGHSVDPTHPLVTAAAQCALEECRELRESLSTAATGSMLPVLPSVTQRIRMVRSELEELATPWADEVVRMVSIAVEQCALHVEAVLLTGGLAQMPLISQRLSADLGIEVCVPDDPTLMFVRGAEKVSAVATPQTEPQRRKASIWEFVRERAARWAAKPRSAPDGATNQTENSVETLLDGPAREPEKSSVGDTSWIPAARKGANLVKQR